MARAVIKCDLGAELNGWHKRTMKSFRRGMRAIAAGAKIMRECWRCYKKSCEVYELMAEMRKKGSGKMSSERIEMDAWLTLDDIARLRENEFVYFPNPDRKPYHVMIIQYPEGTRPGTEAEFKDVPPGSLYMYVFEEGDTFTTCRFADASDKNCLLAVPIHKQPDPEKIKRIANLKQAILDARENLVTAQEELQELQADMHKAE